MEVEKGTVVRSKMGRDKGLFLVVLAVQDNEVLLCDGKERPLERPKRKNIRHVALTSSVLPDHSMKTNREIRKSLKIWNDLQSETFT